MGCSRKNTKWKAQIESFNSLLSPCLSVSRVDDVNNKINFIKPTYGG